MLCCIGMKPYEGLSRFRAVGKLAMFGGLIPSRLVIGTPVGQSSVIVVARVGNSVSDTETTLRV